MQYDMEELLEQANEVQESLSRSYAVPDEIDEADLEAGAPFPIPAVPIYLAQGLNAELDALGMEEEEEGSSYLADLNKAPDFIDEAPIEAPEVRHLSFLLIIRYSYRGPFTVISDNARGHQDNIVGTRVLFPTNILVRWIMYSICTLDRFPAYISYFGNQQCSS